MGGTTYWCSPRFTVRFLTVQYIYKWLFYAVEYADICNFADDTTPHSSSTNVNEAITNLEYDCNLPVEWFRDNYMTLNASKCYLLVSGYQDELMCATVGGSPLWEELSVK